MVSHLVMPPGGEVETLDPMSRGLFRLERGDRDREAKKKTHPGRISQMGRQVGANGLLTIFVLCGILKVSQG